MMKYLATIFLLGLLLCGCSRSHDAAPRTALNRVEPGKDISFGHYVLRVEQRDGSTIRGVRIINKEPDGQTATMTAENGTLSQGADRHSLKIVLYDAKMEKTGQKMSVKELAIDLTLIGL